MKWIYLSPHLDDAVFSCGGLIWEQSKMGDEVEIWTLFSGDPPDEKYSQFALSLHRDWGLAKNMVEARRVEDQNACRILGATPRYFSYLDCIYRKSSQGENFYQTEQEIFGGLNPEDMSLIDLIVEDLADQLPPAAKVAGPLGIGNHVDHDLTRKVCSRLGIPVVYYADYPYARESEGQEILSLLEDSDDWKKQIFDISGEALNKWQFAASAYTSQIPIFWENEGDLMKEIGEFSGAIGGVVLWDIVENK